ncbi:MAG TPA: glycine/betaine ABC transporter substrate-binding protein [Myxococcales bacterium]|nr:glycine/betaine ABC transporter substrate-binding protein [Myxococcales bacterium]
MTRTRPRGATLALLLTLSLLGCKSERTGGAAAETKKQDRRLELVYVEWDSEVASTNLVRAVLEQRLGYRVELTPVSAAAMWQALAAGDADAMVAAWLPTTHGHYLERFKDKLIDLGPNLVGTRIGLAVPAYVDVKSIADLGPKAKLFDGKLVGIDPGAGVMSKTEEAIKAYGIKGIEIVEGSGATMTAALADAIKNKQPIVVTAWTPHWKFARWELKYLEDPKNVFGGDEQIHTFARKGLLEEHPDACAFLDAFHWSPAQMAELMMKNRENNQPYENAKKWVAEHPKEVDAWLAAINKKGGGEAVAK